MRIKSIDLYVYGASYPDAINFYLMKKRSEKNRHLLGIFDDFKYQKESCFMGIPIIGGGGALCEVLLKNENSSIFNNVHSSPRSRCIVANRIKNSLVPFFSIYPSSLDVSCKSIGEGVFIHPNSSFGARVEVLNHVSIKIGAIVSHDCIIRDYSFVGPGVTLCGYVDVGRGSYVGAGAVIKEHVKIGEGAVVGAGSVVLKDVEPWSVVVGVPARKIKEEEFFNFGEANDKF